MNGNLFPAITFSDVTLKFAAQSKTDPNNLDAPARTQAQSTPHPRINLIDKQTDAHSQAFPPISTRSPFSQRLPAVNNKHSDCFDAIKRHLCPLFSNAAIARQVRNPLAPDAVLKVWVLLADIVCYCWGRLFKESKSLNI